MKTPGPRFGCIDRRRGIIGDGRYAGRVPKHPYLLGVAALAAAVLIGLGRPTVQVIVAVIAAYVMFRIGTTLLGGLAAPVPEPPPAGELRKVKIMFRCSLCGTEVRMTVAPDEEPQAPRHCMEDMDLVAPVME